MKKPKVTNTSKITPPRNYLKIDPIPEKVWQDPLYFIAFGFGTGTISFAPGTFGTLIAIPIYLLMQPLSSLAYLILTLIIITGSVWICSEVTREIGVDDHQGMCLDEVVGFLVTMFHAPAGWKWILTGFVLFRLFDIWKPWPISYVDRNIHGGFGIIFDDVLAGIFSCAILQLLAWMLI
jgi:phosphatidylglycerophosphatase A